jgi:hydroxymethylpyrimidine pyrophosphatase-like HAD family hydrolase
MVSSMTNNGHGIVKYQALATDGDGTLLRGGQLAQATVNALERFRKAGGILLLVTGETVKDLKSFPRLDLFHHVVAENGGVLYEPSTNKSVALAEKPSPELVKRLRGQGVSPLKIGEVGVTTTTGCRRAVETVLEGAALPYRVILNRHDLMILPFLIDKASGLTRLLARIKLPAHRVAAIGDAVNDRALIECCGLGAAVANAVPLLKEHAARVTKHGYGKGVVELIEQLLGNTQF